MIIIQENNNSRAISDRDFQLEQLKSKLDIIQDSLNISNAERDTFFEQRKNLQTNIDSISDASKQEQSKLKAIKGSLKLLTNDQLITEANSEANVQSTEKTELLLSRPTVEFLVESAKEVKSLRSQLELTLLLNSNLTYQLKLDEDIFKTYEIDKRNYLTMLDNKNQQIQIHENSLKVLEKQNKGQNRTIKILTGLAIGGIVYGIAK